MRVRILLSQLFKKALAEHSAGAFSIYYLQNTIWRLYSKFEIPAAMMHGTVNAIAGTSMFLVNGGSDLTVGMQGLSGIIAMAITIAVIYFYDRRHDGIMAKGILL
ncbi:MAG: hypothetical protein MJY48_05570 [Bacteroidales bacterium]|nr:hypothetical protein [Bacteroidales bacterium]